MRSGDLIREARLRAGLTQTELAARTGKDRSVIARWEQGVVSPSVETLVSLVRACEFDLSLELVRYEQGRAERLGKNLMLSPERRVQRYLSALGDRSQNVRIRQSSLKVVLRGLIRNVQQSLNFCGLGSPANFG